MNPPIPQSPTPFSWPPPQSTCLWLLTDVQKLPTIKVSPIFKLIVGNTIEFIQISLSNNNDLVQLKLQIEPSILSVAQLFTTIIANVTVILIFPNENIPVVDYEIKFVEKVEMKESGGYMCFETPPLSFKTITNDYMDPFAVLLGFYFHDALPLAMVRSDEHLYEFIRFDWKLKDVKKLPMINPTAAPPLRS